MSALKVQRMSRHISKTTNLLVRNSQFVKRPGASTQISEAVQRLGGGLYEYDINVYVTNKRPGEMTNRCLKTVATALFDESWALQPNHFFHYSEFKSVMDAVPLPEQLKDQDFLCVVDVEQRERDNSLRCKAIGTNNCLDLVEAMVIVDLNRALDRLAAKTHKFQFAMIEVSTSVQSAARVMLSQQPWKAINSTAPYEMKLSVGKYVFCREILEAVIHRLRASKKDPRFSCTFCIEEESEGLCVIPNCVSCSIAKQVFIMFEETNTLFEDDVKKAITNDASEEYGNQYSFQWKGTAGWGTEVAYNIFKQLYGMMVDRLLAACSQFDVDPADITAVLELKGSGETQRKKLVIPPVKIVSA